MVFFTNHYNAISIDRLPTKSKIRKYSVYFNNSLVCRPEVSSARKTFLFLLKMQKKKIKKKKRHKCSCSGSSAIKSGSCRLRFS